MKQTNKQILSAILLVSTCAGIIADGRVVPYSPHRSVGKNAARKVVGLRSHHEDLFDMDTTYGTVNATFGYESSFRKNDMAESLFGTSINDDRELRIAGSNASNINRDTNWDAGNFFLPSDFDGTVKFSPRVQNFLVDLYFYMGLDEWMEGLYFRIYGPIVHARYDLKAEESTSGTFTGSYPAGSLAPATTVLPATSLHKTALAFFQGENQLSIDGITVNKLANAKWKGSKDKETGFGELRAELGWNFLLDEDYHLGVNIQAAAPTGHRPNGEYLFEAQVGNGKAWELGGGASGRYTLWRSCDGCQHFDFFVEADITHLFSARQKRTFDLKGKAHSRYMNAAKFTTGAANVTGLAGLNVDDAAPTGAATVPNAQFAAEYAPVANFSTREIKVDVNVQADIVAMFNYTCNGWSADLGYNFWYRGSEDIQLRTEDEESFEKVWGLVGDASMFGFNGTPAAVALSTTQSDATIHTGTNRLVTDATAAVNTGSDNARLAVNGNPGTIFLGSFDGNGAAVTGAADLTGNARIRTSVNPVLIDVTDLDLEGAQTKGYSHKIFGHINHTWMDWEDWIPYIGIGFEAEFGSNSDEAKNQTSTDTDAFRTSLSKWAVLLKAGVSFD